MNSTEALQRVRQVIRRQHKALATEQSYVFWLRRYISALRAMPQELPSEKKLEQFLTDLAIKRDISASSQNQAFNAARPDRAVWKIPTGFRLAAQRCESASYAGWRGLDSFLPPKGVAPQSQTYFSSHGS